MHRNLAVIHFAANLSDDAFTVQRTISEALESGMNVALICSRPLIHRAERLTFATLFVREFAGRFAIVAPDAHAISAVIPEVYGDQVHVFSHEDEAYSWLDPSPEDEDATLLYLTPECV